MTGKHTPGPWEPSGNDGHGIVIVESKWGSIARIMRVGCAVQEAANAALISAAPDMLEACREALALLGNPDADSTDADRVERVLWAAVRKATGGEGGGV